MWFITKWLIGQAVKTPPSHGGNRGSIPLSAAKKNLEESDVDKDFKVFLFWQERIEGYEIQLSFLSYA